MIRLATLGRTAPAVWLAIPLCLLAGFYVTLLPPSDRYAVDATAKATAVLPFVGAFCAACAAWEAGRLRRARIWGGPWARSRLEIAAWGIVPAVLVGVLAVAIAVGHQLIRSDALGGPDFAILGIAALDLIAYASAGFALGIALPFAIAGPLGIVGTIVWLAFIPAMDPVWLRHLTGMFRDCCGLADQLAREPIIASALVDAAIVLAALAALVGVPARALRRRALASLALLIALVVGSGLVGDLTYAPTVPRDATAMQCDGRDRATICLWPEHVFRAAEVGDIADSVISRWNASGIEAPAAFTEAAPEAAPRRSVTFEMRSDASTDEIIGALAAAMLPPLPDCFGGYTGGPAFQYLEAWYAYVGGMSEETWLAHYETEMEPLPAVPTLVGELAAATPSVRQAWTDRAREVSQACEDWEPSRLAVHQ